VSCPQNEGNIAIISQQDSCAAALEERESREMGWGMYEAIEAADMSLRNDRSLDDFRKNVEMVFGLLRADAASSSDDPKT
jgi:hypothetical protein